MPTAMTGTRVAGTKVPGQSKEVTEYPITGAAAVDHNAAPGRPFRIVGVRMHLSAAPTTSENFTVALNDGTGADYDVVLYKRDLSVGSVTDLVLSGEDLSLEEGHIFKSTDSIDIDWANTDTRTYGTVLLLELM